MNKEFTRKYMAEQGDNIKHLQLKVNMTQDKEFEKHNSMIGGATIGPTIGVNNETYISNAAAALAKNKSPYPYTISLASLAQFRVESITKDMILAAQGVREWEIFVDWLKSAQRDMPETVIQIIQKLMNGHYNR